LWSDPVAAATAVALAQKQQAQATGAPASSTAPVPAPAVTDSKTADSKVCLQTIENYLSTSIDAN
jgi:hypothetical protein